MAEKTPNDSEDRDQPDESSATEGPVAPGEIESMLPSQDSAKSDPDDTTEPTSDALDELLSGTADEEEDGQPTSKRSGPPRWMWFTIAGIGLLLIVGAGFVWWTSAPEQADVVEAELADAADRWAELIAQVRDEELPTIRVTDFDVTDEMCEQLVGLNSLENVILDRGVVGDDALTSIATLPKLQHLRLRLSPITDEGVAKLTACKDLWLLNLPHSKITSAGVRSLVPLPRLRQLRIGTDRAGNEICRAIAELTTLRGVHTIGIAVTDEGMKVLADMPHLESLYLDDSTVTDIGWQWLFATKPQLHIHVDQTHHDRDPQSHEHR